MYTRFCFTADTRYYTCGYEGLSTVSSTCTCILGFASLQIPDIIHVAMRDSQQSQVHVHVY